MRPRVALVVAVLLPTVVLTASPAIAAAGDLDPTYDGDGRVVADLTPGDDVANCVVVQPNGKTVAIGRAGGQFALTRFNLDGTPDPTFGANGKVLTDFGSGSDGASCGALQSDGKIVAVGSAGGGARFAVARYTPNGTLDPTFSTDGRTRTDLSSGMDEASGVVIEGNGRIVAVGYSDDAGRFAAVRYLPDGTLDPSFSNDGKTRNDVTSGYDRAMSAALQGDGKIVAGGLAGGTNAGNSDTTVALLRYTTDGSLDPSFSNDGRTRNDVSPGFDYAGSLAIQSDGRIVAAGGSNQEEFAALRYAPDGSLDPAFSTDGKVRTDVSPTTDAGGGVVVQSDGRIVVGGMANGAFGLVRYLENGGLDATWSGDGKVITAFPEGSSGIDGLAIQANGKIVAGGFAGSALALARYLAT